MGSVLTDIRRWQNERASGAEIPRIISPGPKLDGATPEQKFRAPKLPDIFVLTAPEEAREEVDILKKQGVDFIKVHEGMSPGIYDALVQESKAVGLRFEGHLPLAGALAAAQAAKGQEGVRILAGTNVGDSYIIPGYALHDELELMVHAGDLTWTTLQSATSEPALAFGLTSIVGSVAAGQAADCNL